MINLKMETVTGNSFGRFLTTGEPPASSYLLSFHKWADIASTLRWYARTAGSLLRRINLRMETLYLTVSLYGFRHYSFIFVFHYRSTRSGEQKSPPAEPHAGRRH
jgi:hypothetical protein